MKPLSLLFAIASAILVIPPSRADITIKAFVDGSCALRVTAQGFQWENGEFAKPGRLDFHNYPTFIDSYEWIPQWSKPKESRGSDTSDLFPFPVGGINLDLELLSVSEDIDGTDYQERSPIRLRFQDDALLVLFSDDEPGARWYTFVLRPASTEQGAAVNP